jgi:hypothetical protein
MNKVWGIFTGSELMPEGCADGVGGTRLHSNGVQWRAHGFPLNMGGHTVTLPRKCIRAGPCEIVGDLCFKAWSLDNSNSRQPK